MTVTVEQAMKDLDRLLKNVQAGEEMVITQNGQPVARIVPDRNGQHPPADRVPGTAKGMIAYTAPDFDAPLDDFKEYME